MGHRIENEALHLHPVLGIKGQGHKQKEQHTLEWTADLVSKKNWLIFILEGFMNSESKLHKITLGKVQSSLSLDTYKEQPHDPLLGAVNRECRCPPLRGDYVKDLYFFLHLARPVVLFLTGLSKPTNYWIKTHGR